MRHRLYPKRQPVKGRPPRDDVRDVLHQVLVAFGLAEAVERAKRSTRRSQQQARHGVVYNAADNARELSEAEPMIRETAGAIVALRASRLMKPTAYADAWSTIVERWNAALDERGWQTIAPLCKACGLPILLRGRNGRASETCSDACRNTAKKRRDRQRRK